MYEDDLSDLLPQSRTVLPSFNDDVDDPFKNPFNDGADPWATQPACKLRGMLFESDIELNLRL
jgi:hypothetical protein